MYKIIFYRDVSGRSEISDYLDELYQKKDTSKEARVMLSKIVGCMEFLAQFGTRMGAPCIKHIEDDIWELRPKNSRIFFFYWKSEEFVLLSHYSKKTQKTPRREIEKAKRNRKSWIERNGV